MKAPYTKHLEVIAGDSFIMGVQWEIEPWVYKPIQNISSTLPMTLTVTGHGMVSKQRCAIVGVTTMVEANAKHDPPRDPDDFHAAKRLTDNSIELNELDSSTWTPYGGVANGFIKYATPQDLTGVTARMAIKDAKGLELLRLTTENGGIAVDVATKIITVTMTDVQTASLKNGKYDLEVIKAGVVKKLLVGRVRVAPESTT